MVKKNGEIVNNCSDKNKKTEKIMKIITGIILLIILGYHKNIIYELIINLFS